MRIRRRTAEEHPRTRISNTELESCAKTNKIPFSIFVLAFSCLVLFSLIEPMSADWLMDCGDCHCKWNSGKKTADCRNLTLAGVPENLSPEVQVLDLSNNRVLYLEQNAFLNAELHNLHKLYIRNSSMQQIDPRSFTQLEILIELDLSYNHLRSLLPNQFARLVKVRAIVLNGNLLEALTDGIFKDLKYLHKIELKANRLKRIGPQVFVNLPLLSQIYLDGNQFNYLRKESFENLKRLTALSLDQNPWNCTCELQVFRDFALKRNLYTAPTACYYPEKLRGMLWVEDQPEAFACKPKIIFPSRGASISTSKENVTLTCRVHASPNTHIAWDYNKQMYRSNSALSTAAQRIHIQLVRDEQSKEKEFGRDVFVSRLTIVGAEKSDEGTYTCLAENAGGKDSVQMSLLVQKPNSRDLLLLQGNVVTVITFMILGLLSVSIFLATVTFCLYKRFKALNGASPHHHQHMNHHHQLGDQLVTPGGSNDRTNTGTTVLAGNTDVSLSIGADESASLSSFKNHMQKAGLGKNVDDMRDSSKCSELTKNNGSVIGLDKREANTIRADKTYLERSKDEKLHIKYPHGPATPDYSISNEYNNSNSNSNSNINISSMAKSNPKDMRENGVLNIGGGRSAGSGSELFQPDLLPAYSSNSNSNINKVGSNSSQQGQLYSPIKTSRTINPTPEDHHQQQHYQQLQQQHHLPQSDQFAIKGSVSMAKTSFNNKAKEYLLQSKYSTLANLNKANEESNAKRNANKLMTLTKPKATTAMATAMATANSIPLTTSTSMSMTAAAGTGITQESTFPTTLQRHSKSIALPLQQSRNALSGSTTSSTYIAQPQHQLPTERNYEYRQPPPPPYNAVHRTSGAMQMSHQKNNTSTGANEEKTTTSDSGGSNMNLSKDQSFRDSGSKYNSNCISDKDNVVGSNPLLTANSTTRQTIVTASSSMNFLTTTEYTTTSPQQRLL